MTTDLSCAVVWFRGVENSHGNSTTYNLNQLLANNIYECDYFRAL